MRRDAIIEAAAVAAHEANRAFCRLQGDDSQVHWEDAPAWQQRSAYAGVEEVLRGATPEELHEAWAQQKRREGWIYGPQKDAVAKTHPCLVAYEDLEPAQQAKDALFLAVIRAMLDAGGRA